jgi:hypothetical protein
VRPLRANLILTAIVFCFVGSRPVFKSAKIDDFSLPAIGYAPTDYLEMSEKG